MRRVCAEPAAPKWDIARVDRAVEGPAGVSAWTATYAARALGFALTGEPAFFEDVAAARLGLHDPLELARRYIRRDLSQPQGAPADELANVDPRRRLVALYLERGSEAPPYRNGDLARMATWSVGMRAWFVRGEVTDPAAPRRPLRRKDAQNTINHGAIRVARRGARRCVHYHCMKDDIAGRGDEWTGVLLGSRSDDYCHRCAKKLTVRHRKRGVDAEREMFASAVAAVFGGDSRPGRRRVSR